MRRKAYFWRIRILFLLLLGSQSDLNTFDSDFNCTTRKSTLSHTTVLLLQVMRFAKLNKPPLSIKPPLKKCLKKYAPPPGA